MPARAFHKISEAVPSTTAGVPDPPAPTSPRSRASCPAWRRSSATCSSTASSSSVCAEPMCSMLSTRRPRLCTIWTAVAPKTVFTRRTNTPTTLCSSPDWLGCGQVSETRVYKIARSLQLRSCGQQTHWRWAE
jgi:hypothetical protein